MMAETLWLSPKPFQLMRSCWQQATKMRHAWRCNPLWTSKMLSPYLPGNSSRGYCLNTFSPRDQRFSMTYNTIQVITRSKVAYSKYPSFVRRLLLLNTIQVDTYMDIQCSSASSFNKYRLHTYSCRPEEADIV